MANVKKIIDLAENKKEKKITIKSRL